MESAAHLGRCRYVELATFAALGARAGDGEDPVLSGLLAGASRAHGWRAVQLESCLPVSVGFPDAAACTVSPGASFDAALADLVARASVSEVVAGLVDGLYPAMLDGYRERLAAANPASDGPVALTLGRVVADLETLRSGLLEAARTVGAAADSPAGSGFASPPLFGRLTA